MTNALATSPSSPRVAALAVATLAVYAIEVRVTAVGVSVDESGALRDAIARALTNLPVGAREASPPAIC